MEPIFNSHDLYNHVNCKLEMPIPTSLKLSVLFKSVQKDFPVDDYMVVIFINYIRCLIKLQSDDILMVFKTSKLKYFKYLVYWKEYLSYVIQSENKIDKVIDEGIKFIDVKEFSNKSIILEYLLDVKGSTDRSKYIYYKESEWMTIDDLRTSCNLKKEFTDVNNISKKEFTDVNNISKKEFTDVNNTLKKENSDFNNKENNINYNFKVQFDDFSYSPLLKKNLKYYPNTPITDDCNKYSYKDIIKEEVIKCKIEDITIKEEDFKINNNIKEEDIIKVDKVKVDEKEHFFFLNYKKLLKINIIGKGGSSKVYKVLHGNEFYALKIINIEMDSTLKDLLLEEINLLKKLKGVEGIIKMIDYEILTDNIYILLEYGESVLSTFMKNNKYIDNYCLHSNRVKYIWQEILLIVQNIHDKRIIHGDLKPANFVFVKNKLKIIDFGISKTLNNNTTRLDLDMVCGTLNYCAPEIFFENKKRRSSDVWSLGIILHELWYGKTPLDKYKTYLEKKENIINIRKDLKITGLVDEVISKCLHEDCNSRPKVKDLLGDSFVCSDIRKT